MLQIVHDIQSIPKDVRQQCLLSLRCQSKLLYADVSKNTLCEYRQLKYLFYHVCDHWFHGHICDIYIYIYSRNFGISIDGVKTAALVPMADMLNHVRPRETSWQYDDAVRGFTITALSGISISIYIHPYIYISYRTIQMCVCSVCMYLSIDRSFYMSSNNGLSITIYLSMKTRSLVVASQGHDYSISCIEY